MAEPVQITLLSTILGADFPLALERQRSVGIRFLDLKDGLWGKTIEQLNTQESVRAADLIRQHGLQVHCFSTSIGRSRLEADTNESTFRARHEPALENALRVAQTLLPRVIRLLPPCLSPDDEPGAVERMLRDYPWIIGVYRDWSDRVVAAGFGVLIENEVSGCVLRSVDDVVLFFKVLDSPSVRYTWDIQNLWQTGTFPDLGVYRQLQPLIGAVHLKGGRAGNDGKTLTFAASLDEASWNALEIVRAVVADSVAPFLCLNPSHGEKPSGWDMWQVAEREIAFLRREIPELTFEKPKNL